MLQGDTRCQTEGTIRHTLATFPMFAAEVTDVRSKFMNKEGSFSRSILASAITPGQLLDPELEEIINSVSSGDEDDPIDPQDEAKYEEILKGIED